MPLHSTKKLVECFQQRAASKTRKVKILNNIFRKIKSLFTILVLVLLLIPVVVSSGAAEEVNKNKPITRMAIIPFQAVSLEVEQGNSVACPLCGTVYFGGKIAKGGEKIVEELFFKKMKDYNAIEIIAQDKVDAIYKRISVESLKMPLLEIYKKVGMEIDADLVAVGYIFRYVERVGYDYSVEKAASVALEINFINSKDGSIVWRGAFDKTQKSLMEDVFQIASFYKGHGKWLTARELAKQGINQALKTFSGLEH
jgi:hypothetical protein